MLLGIICLLLIGNFCIKKPILYPGGQDVLNPSPEVLANPHGVTEDGYFKVDTAYIQWVQVLQIEVMRLRELIK